MYTVSEAAELLGIGRSTAYELVARRELATVRIGGRRFVTRPTLEALIGFEPPSPVDLEAAPAKSTHPEPALSPPAPKPTRRHSTRSQQAHLPLS